MYYVAFLLTYAHIGYQQSLEMKCNSIKGVLVSNSMVLSPQNAPGDDNGTEHCQVRIVKR